MRNLFLFFVRFNSFFIFLALEVVCFVFIIRGHSYHQASFLNSTNALTGNIYQTYDNVTDYLYLKTVNDSLLREIARLKTEQETHFREMSLEKDTVLTDTSKILYTFIPARVINNSTDRINNYITLDKGSKDGIQPEMGVVGPHGIVGIVRSVSENFTSVMSVLHKNSRISVKIKRLRYPGSLQWDGASPDIASLKAIPQHLNIQEGDTVVTSGYSAIFPEDQMVGTIQEFSTIPGSNFYEIRLKLSTNFKTIHYAYVVNYKLKEEKSELESTHD